MVLWRGEINIKIDIHLLPEDAWMRLLDSTDQ